MRQIYLDNGATAFPKAPGVGQAMADYIENVGVSVNRSSYRASTDTALRTLEVRERLCRLLGFAGDCAHAVFTSGVTQSLNMLMKGLVKPGDRLVISGMEHNAVARPAKQLEDAGAELCIAPCSADGRLRPDELEKLLPGARLAVIQQASNVSGTVQGMDEIGRLCRAQGVPLVVDAAQTAGHFPVEMDRWDAAAVCFTGHKGLLGPQGIGGFILTDALASAETPLLAGGTGSQSALLEMPESLPDRFEAGTPNIPGILGLGAALEFIETTGVDTIRRREDALTRRFLDGLRGAPELFVPGPGASGRVGVVSVDFKRRDNAEVAFELEQKYGVLTRCGLHCAPLAHRTLGTFPEGTVRFSLGWFNTEADVDDAVRAILALA